MEQAADYVIQAGTENTNGSAWGVSFNRRPPQTYIQLCLAISHQALVQRGASRMKTQPENEKYTFRTWLLRLGMIGDEFKTARRHLLKNLEGSIAWRDPAQAEAQKARLAAKRLAEWEAEEQRHSEEESVAEPEEQEQNAPAPSMQTMQM